MHIMCFTKKSCLLCVLWLKTSWNIKGYFSICSEIWISFYSRHKAVTCTGTTEEGVKGMSKCTPLTGRSLIYSIKKRQGKLFVFIPWKCNFVYLLMYQKIKSFSLSLPFTNQNQVLSILVKQTELLCTWGTILPKHKLWKSSFFCFFSSIAIIF